jgi:hypothetical protein
MGASFDLVQVQFENRANPGTFGGGAYTYIADHPVSVGDIVNVPTKYGERDARVVKTDVPVGDIQCRVGQLRHITAPAISGGDLFSGFFD